MECQFLLPRCEFSFSLASFGISASEFWNFCWRQAPGWRVLKFMLASFGISASESFGSIKRQDAVTTKRVVDVIL